MTVLRIVAGSANPGLAQAVANYLGVGADGCTLQRFADGELRPQIENVCGADVYIVQPTSPPVNEHLVELLLLVDACRRSRAGRVTAVVPDIVVAATHGLFVDAAAGRLQQLGLRRVLVTDSVAVKNTGATIEIASLAPTIADAIACLRADKPLP